MSLVLGVIGHVDHGKTALVRALTGEDTDRLPEEKQRGVSIVLGFARLELGQGLTVDLIDMPGHERFVRTMISGATGIDAVLLVVAANEGVKPQTVEHIDIAGLLGLKRAVVAISKADLAASETARAVADDVLRLLARAGLEAAEPIMTDAPQGRGVAELRQRIETLAAEQPTRRADGVAFLPIDRAFSIPGHGPVVTGTLRGAAVSAGDLLELWPAARSVRVRAVQVHGGPVSGAAPGQRVALNLRDVALADLERGMVLAAPEALAPSDWLTIAVRAVESAPPLKNGTRLRALLGAVEVDARLRLLDRDVLEPGQSGFAQLHCAVSLVAPAGEPVLLRIPSPARTVAGGKVLEPVTTRRRRHCPSILERLEDLRTLAPADLLAAEVRRQGLAGTSLRQLSQLTALPQRRIAQLLASQPAVVTRSGLVVCRAAFDRLSAAIPPLLRRQAEGLSRDQLSAALPRSSSPVLDLAVERLVSRGAVVRRGALFMAPRPAEDRIRAGDEAERAARIAEALRQGGLMPPAPREFLTDPQAKAAVDRLLREGVVVLARDRAKGREILFHREAIDTACRQLEPLLETEAGVLATEVGSALGISRKYTMPLLDHLDTIRFTRRVDERRTRGARFPCHS